jgi:hypothetical protein
LLSAENPWQDDDEVSDCAFIIIIIIIMTSNVDREAFIEIRQPRRVSDEGD